MSPLLMPFQCSQAAHSATLSTTDLRCLRNENPQTQNPLVHLQ
uniref:Uncharacterized protein n=1 Tax=Corynebacterium glutamicum TaxID=1718 RepID=D2KYA4_CORGT|nr:hypothetical protein [Corynebacterium glutamicum]